MRRDFVREFGGLIYFIALMWLMFYVSQNFLWMYKFGIIPRHPNGLIGIVCSPFLHGNINHLFHNTLCLAIFGTMFCLMEGKNFFGNAFYLIIISGIITWVIGKKGIHIGASGLVFGLWSQLLFGALYTRKIKYFIISVFVAVFFGNFFLGAMPTSTRISWEAHLGGIFAGLLAAGKLGK